MRNSLNKFLSVWLCLMMVAMGFLVVVNVVSENVTSNLENRTTYYGEKGLPQVWIDKKDYYPEEIIVISGANYSSNDPIEVKITRPDNKVHFLNTTADESGSFMIYYQLNGILGEYLIRATDEHDLTNTTTFTDGKPPELFGYDWKYPKWSKSTLEGYGAGDWVWWHIAIYNANPGEYKLVWNHDYYKKNIDSYGFMEIKDVRLLYEDYPNENETGIPVTVEGPFYPEVSNTILMQFNATFIITTTDDYYLRWDVRIDANETTPWPGSSLHTHFEEWYYNGELQLGGQQDVQTKQPLSPPLSKISGYKWNDLDGNGIWDCGEPGLESWAMHLTGEDIYGKNISRHNTTNETGFYQFAGLIQGDYTVCEELKDGWTCTNRIGDPPCTDIITITEDNTNFANVNFGNIFNTITVTGYLYYWDNLESDYYPCRYADCELWDDDILSFDDLLDTGYTTATGYFSLGPVDNTDGEGGTQDIYVEFYANTAATRVYDSDDNTWWCVTPTVENVPCGTYDFGSQEVPNGQRGAWNIYDQIIDGYQYIDNRPNTDAPPQVAVEWYPGNTDGTYYVKGGDIHIRGDDSPADWTPDEFDDGIVLHEYGHYIANQTWSSKPYSFDNSPGGDHWWPNIYSQELAWSEGWAHYLACVVRDTNTYRDTWSTPSLFYMEYNLENGEAKRVESGSETGTWYGNNNGAGCEASVAGVLWDIYDAVNDDYDDDGIGDTLSAGSDKIWEILRTYSTSGHGVYTIHEFWDGWFDKSYGDDQKMWAVFYEHGINKDWTPPTNPTSHSSSHQLSVWSNDNTIDISWSGATDDLSGVYGYSFEWSTSSTTIPDTTADTTATSNTSLPLADSSSWYFHVRTRDNASNWASDAYHVGPFKVDTGLPTNPNSHSCSHTVDVWSNDNTIWIEWSGAFDSLSDVYGYSYQWSASSTTVPNTSVDTTGTSTTSPALADGSSWYFHVRTRDNAGNWATGAYHVGPFKIDTQLPSSPTNLSISLDQSDCVLQWVAASDSSGGSGIKHYKIYRSTTCDGFNFGSPFATTTSTSWRDIDAGDNNPNNYFYIVRSMDNASNEDLNNNKVGKYVIALSVGRSLISIPLVQSDTNITAVLETIEGNYSYVEWYDPLDTTDHWRSYSTSKPEDFNDLLTLNHTRGLWITMIASDNLTIAGIVPESTSIQLYEGWNFVSYSSFIDRNVLDVLAGIPYEQVEGFNESAPPYYLKILLDSDVMSAGNGYWIHVTFDCVWTIYN